MSEQGLATRPASAVDRFMAQVLPDQDRQAIQSSLPRHVNFARFERNLTNALMAEPKLLNCNPREVFREVAKLAALGLYIDPALGESYLIVGWPGGKPVPQARIGYRGLLKLARQSGDVAGFYARDVCQNDQFECVEGTDRFLRHVPDYFSDDRGPTVGYYAVVEYKDGAKDFEIMGMREIYRIRDRSDGWKAFKAEKIKSTPWATDESEMAKKTVIRRLAKRTAQSPDLAAAIEVEDRAEYRDIAQSPIDMRSAVQIEHNPLSNEGVPDHADHGNDGDSGKTVPAKKADGAKVSHKDGPSDEQPKKGASKAVQGTTGEPAPEDRSAGGKEDRDAAEADQNDEPAMEDHREAASDESASGSNSSNDAAGDAPGDSPPVDELKPFEGNWTKTAGLALATLKRDLDSAKTAGEVQAVYERHSNFRMYASASVKQEIGAMYDEAKARTRPGRSKL